MTRITTAAGGVYAAPRKIANIADCLFYRHQDFTGGLRIPFYTMVGHRTA